MFGQAATAAVGVGIDIVNAVQSSQLQSKFKKILEDSAVARDYVNICISKLQSQARLAAQYYDPSTAQFNQYLTKLLKPEINYQGNCTADIPVPINPSQILATYFGNGFVRTTNPAVPLDTGLTWSTACKNAYDSGKVTFIQAAKDRRNFELEKYVKEQSGESAIYIKYTMGIILVGMILYSIVGY